MKYFKLKTFAKIVIDLVIFAVLLAAIYISFNVSLNTHFAYFLFYGVLARLLTRLLLNIYFDVSPITGVKATFRMGITVFIAYLTQYVIFRVFYGSVAGAAVVNSPLILAILVIAETFLLIIYRFWRRIIKSLLYVNKNRFNTLIVGAGEGGKIVIEEITNNSNLENYVVGFIDDDPAKVNKYYMGNKILGTTDDVEQIIKERGIREIIVSTPNYDKLRMQSLIRLIDKYNISVKRVSLLSEEETTYGIRELSIEELLNREPTAFDTEGVSEFIQDKVILVTGAGGSIGSELCRQITKRRPKTLILFDIYENGAYDIQQELKFENGDSAIEFVTLIGSVYNEERIKNIFAKYRPNIVFHAAAYKHVPLMEDSPMEAIRTNVVGTYNVAKQASLHNVDKFIFVSTDKAVRPTNVMGATKRFAEQIIQYFDSNSETSYSAVRFGNVLGSSGSVVPLFRHQIEKGGPITITDSRITRFFMTIPEAVSLILQSAVYASNGDIFILDMGEPVKIIDLAHKMIVQAGLVPHVDIKFKEVGLRPGEKLYEELLLDPQKHKKTQNKLIFIEEKENIRDVARDMQPLVSKLETLTEEDIKSELQKLVASYTRNGI